MSTLIYTPSIKCHVLNSQGQTIDLSEDLVSWTLTLRENAMHTFSFKLQNSQRKYDGMFLPMDRITVALKRINWLSAFTGYLDSSPLFQAWPGTLDLAASCTLKTAMYHYWDPNTNAAYNMIQNAFTAINKGKPAPTQADKGYEGDPGLKQLIYDSMEQVLGWNKARIHVGRVPTEWFKWAGAIEDEVDKEIAFYKDVGGGGSTNVPGAAVQIPKGTYGGRAFNETNMKWASYIYSTINNDMKLSNRTDIKIMAIMCAIVESGGMYMYANKYNPASLAIPHDRVGENYASVGLFQQQPGGAPHNSGADWGTTAELMDPVISTKKFVTPLLKIVGKSPIQPSGSAASIYGDYIHGVQHDDPNAYHSVYGPAKAIVDAADKIAKAAPATTTSSTTAGTSSTTTDTAPSAASATVAASTGSMIAVVAVDLINTHKADKKWIIYNEGNDDPDTTDKADVKTLDCSSLVDWCYYHATGGDHLAGKGGGRNTVATIHAKSKVIPLALAKFVQGAVLIEPDGHVGVSCGDGKMHVAAHDKYSDPSLDCNISKIDGNGFSIGGLLPHIDYSGSATTDAAMAQLKSVAKYSKVTKAPSIAGVAPPDETGNAPDAGTAVDPYLAIVNSVFFNADTEGYPIGQSLGGPVMLINDTPFLPWLQQVCASSMRSFCSAPNGDFIAWFPDYFGIWSNAAILKIEPIELQNFAVYWSDANIVTHQFVIGSSGSSAFDPTSGGLMANNATSDLASLAKQTSGIATMDFPEIFKVIYGDTGKAADAGFIQAYLQRFGARPATDSVPNVQKDKPAFYYALYLFLQRWAAQFTAAVPTTFMPEAFPGMLLQIEDYGFQAYVQQVTHTASYGPGGGFKTQLGIAAPSTIGAKNRKTALAWLPESQAL